MPSVYAYLKVKISFCVCQNMDINFLIITFLSRKEKEAAHETSGGIFSMAGRLFVYSCSCPSTIRTMRFADWATLRSWVIMTMVLPMLFSSLNSFNTSLPLV